MDPGSSPGRQNIIFMNIFILSPVIFINNITPFEVHFVVFCAVWLPWIAIGWVLIYLLYRSIPNRDIFGPLENISARFFHIAVVSLSALGARIASVVLKNYFQIGRPILLNFNLHPILTLTDYGFPSSHAAVFSAIATSLFLINRRAGIFATLLALIIGTARIFAGVHTPLDILGGYILGTVIALAFSLISQSVSKKK